MSTLDFPRSVSQRRALRRCSYLWYLRYVEGWQPRRQRGTYLFGDVWQGIVEAVLLGQVKTPEQAYALFLTRWEPSATMDHLEWGAKATWAMFRERAKGLAAQTVPFLQARFPIGSPHPGKLNVRFTYPLADGIRETVIPDYVGPCVSFGTEEFLTGKTETLPNSLWSVVDWKTSDRVYEPLLVEQDSQLTSYSRGAELEYGKRVEQVALVVFCYTVAPKIQVLSAPRRDEDTQAHFLAGAVSDHRRILEGQFTKNPDACFARGACEMVPRCYASQRQHLEEWLIQGASRGEEQDVVGEWG